MKCEFSLAHYKECIEKARDSGYTIKPVKEYGVAPSPPNDPNEVLLVPEKKVILMRHDIDFSLEYAYELANFEYDLGICSSYYVYLHSPTYSALSPKSMGMIKAMKGMGHEIGLHYDNRYYCFGEYDVLQGVMDRDSLGYSDEKIQSHTQHWPAETDKPLYVITNPNDLKLKYISDSGRNWREGCMCNHIGKENLHINVHPEWWASNTDSREHLLNRLYTTLEARLAEDMRGVKQMLKDYERDVINK